MDDFEEFRSTVRHVVEGVGKMLSPKEDWEPCLLLWVDNEETDEKLMSVVQFDSRYLATEAAKERLAQEMANIIRAKHPHAAAFVSSAWSVTLTRDVSPELVDETRRRFERGESMAPPVQAKHHPARVESVQVMMTYEDGRMTLESGTVERHKRSGPTISEWEEWVGDAEGAKGVLEGRFVDPMKEVFRG